MSYGIYIHIPFCLQTCKYCHFITVPYHPDTVEKYRAAVGKEIALYAASLKNSIKVDSVYFGGGTPSLLPAEHILRIIDSCREFFDLSNDCEITIEANPCTLGDKNCGFYEKAGVNRLSIGAQSFHDLELQSIGRLHKASEIFESVRVLKKNGFRNISLDLLLGLPFQTKRTWLKNLSVLQDLGITHVSVYMLDLDEPCELSRSVAEGSVTIPDDDSVADLYLETIDRLKTFGFQQYEISNFSRPGYACRHNLKYWERKPVIGFGLASHSFNGHSRSANVSDMQEYLQALEENRLPVKWRKAVKALEELAETLFLGLRLNRGIQWALLKRDYGAEYLVEYETILKNFASRGLVAWEDSTVHLTPAGMLLSNEIFQQFVN